ncbi:MAG: rhomboid family intramembrane serine protease [Candidatus Velthaea sp.]
MLTRLLIAVNVLAYLWQTATGDVNNAEALIAQGALFGPAVAAGEWWRIVTGEFLHGGWLHIATNMIALYQVGTFVEMLYGSRRMALIYAVSIAGSGAVVLLFNFNVPTVGASGAIFGLFGALLAAGLRLGKPGRQLVQQSSMIIVLNLGLGLTVFRGIVSNAGHLGGLAAGFLAGALLFMGARYAAATAPPPVAEPVETDGGIYEPPEYVESAGEQPPRAPVHDPGQ